MIFIKVHLLKLNECTVEYILVNVSLFKFHLMTLKITLFILMLSISMLSVEAQKKAFDSWSFGINGGSYGAGVQGATTLSPNFKFRVGFDYFNYNINESFDININHNLDDYNSEGYYDEEGIYHEGDYSVSAEMRDTKITFPNFKVLIDYYPMKNGIFSLTGGFYYGKNKLSTNGIIHEYQEMVEYYEGSPELKYYDINITPNPDGSFDGLIEMGSTFKPYLGIGLGRTIPKNRIGFKFELGMVHQGKYSLTSSNISERREDIIKDFLDYEEEELPFSRSLLDWWPMLNFSLTYRIK